jgi:predicted PurR-regulated permease PerM
MTETPSLEALPPRRAAMARRIAGIAAALALLALAVWMLATFLPALAWAVVLAIALWPLFVAARRRVGRDWAAVVMTVLILVAILGPLAFAIVEASRAYGTVVEWIGAFRRHEVETPGWIANLPLIGATIADWLNSRLKGDQPLVGANVAVVTEWGRIIGGQAVRRIATLFFALIIVFFVFRHSDTLLQQTHIVSHRLLGPPAYRFLEVAVAAVRGTVDGMLAVAFGEAVLLGIAYKLAGVPHPALLGVVTGIFSVVPFASPLVFLGAGLWLLAESAIVAAIVLVAFGSLVVFVADHFVRPVLIGGSTQLPFVWVLLGILGGVETFGLLGLLLGPALLAVLVALWRELATPVALEGTGSEQAPSQPTALKL